MPAEGWSLGRHAFDLLVFAVLMYLTEGPTSPFFVLLTFVMLSGTLLWQWRGALLTGAAYLLILTGFEVTAVLGAANMQFEITRTVIRGVYLDVAALTLASLGFYQTQVRAELWRLTEQPIGSAANLDWPIRETLAYAAGVLRVSRALLVWSEPDEPWICLSLWQAGHVHQEQASPEASVLWTPECPPQDGQPLRCRNPAGPAGDLQDSDAERQAAPPLSGIEAPWFTVMMRDYIKQHNLQNPENRREILADDKLEAVFGKKKVTMFEMNKHLAQHLS